MNVPLAEMCRYNRWATLTLVDGCRALTEEQLDLRQPWTSGSVRELLLHIVGGQQTLALRTDGRQHEGELNRASEWPGWDAVRSAAEQSADNLIAIAETLDEDVDIDLAWLGKRYRYPRSFFLVHAIEHGTEHRAELKLLLASVGIATPDLDGWEFAAAMGYGTEVTPA